MIERLLGEVPEDGFSAACHRATGGNPFLLVELMASVRDDRLPASTASAKRIRSLAPKAVARSVVVRLGRLPREAAALAGCVAVLGGEGELRHAAALANLEVDSTMAAADALAAAGLFEAGRPLRLIHPVVRTALYAELPAGERARLHGRAAAVLAQDGADPSAVCAHLLESEPAGDPWTTNALINAAERALARGAPRTAVRYLRRALAEPPPAGSTALGAGRLASAESAVGDAAAAEHVDQAIGLITDRRQRAELAVDQSVAYLASGRFGTDSACSSRPSRTAKQATRSCAGAWRHSSSATLASSPRTPRSRRGTSSRSRATCRATAQAHAHCWPR